MSTKVIRAKPVKLQLNNTGAWKDVMRFDAADDVAGDQVQKAANTLGNLDAEHVCFRIVTEEAYPHVLTSWTKEAGWKPATAHH